MTMTAEKAWAEFWGLTCPDCSPEDYEYMLNAAFNAHAQVFGGYPRLSPPIDEAACEHYSVEAGSVTDGRTVCGTSLVGAAAPPSQLVEPASEWISVRERLPGPVENPEKLGHSYWGLYIVCVQSPNISKDPIVIPATWTGKWRNEGGFDLNVTHWQPLPDPPSRKPEDKEQGR